MENSLLQLIKLKHKELNSFDFYNWIKDNNWDLQMLEEKVVMDAYNHGAVQGYEYANSSTKKELKSGHEYYQETYLPNTTDK